MVHYGMVVLEFIVYIKLHTVSLREKVDYYKLF